MLKPLLLLPLCLTFSSAKLALVMLDGFRWDYIDRLTENQVPNFKSFISSGVRAEYVQPIFPSESFPSWTTIVTGLRADHHGIVGNYFYDRESGKEFSLTHVNRPGDASRDPIWWEEHIPLWISATEEGLRTSLYLWSLCDVPFNGVLPEKCAPYDLLPCLSINVFGDNLDQAAQDLRDGFDLTMIYYGNVDEIGHIRGPESTEVDQEVMNVDFWLGYFQDVLEEYGIADETDIVIMTDHGMTESEGKVSTKVTNFIDADSIEMACEVGAYMQIGFNDPDLIDEAVSNLTAWNGVDVYKKEDVPEYLSYQDSEYIMDVVIVSQGEEITNSDFLHSAKFLPQPTPGVEDVEVLVSGGQHGFDDASPVLNEYQEGNYPDMRGIFLAKGPSFKQGFVNPWIKLIDEYQVFLEVLGIQGEPHEGTYERVQDMFA